MDKQFTASEVRKKEIWLNDAVVRKMLHAFADLLEAREKAVPVYQHRNKSGPMLRWFDCSAEDFELMEHNDYDKEHFDRRILYTHPSPADAERLAEALRNLVSEWVAIADDGDATLEDSAIGYRACANRLSAMLAAHDAQAQLPANLEKMPRMEQLRRFVEWERANNPERTHIAEWALRRIAYLEAQSPAVGVTFATPETEEDVMAYLQIAKLHIKRFREILQAALTAQENPNGL